MVEILKHFERSEKDDIIVYQLREDEIDSLISELSDDFRLCYISDDELERLAKKNKVTKSEFLQEYVLPDIGNVKSGDFGEIFSYYVVAEHHMQKGIELTGPLKWRWKDKNKPAPYTDVVLFHFGEKGKDLLVAVEVKMKATKSERHRLQDAIDGSEGDRLSRLAKTLTWLEEKHARQGEVEKKSQIERFSDPSKHGSYVKKFKAIAIIDNEFFDDEIAKEISKNEEIVVIAFSFTKLKEAYEETRLKIINSVIDE